MRSYCVSNQRFPDYRTIINEVQERSRKMDISCVVTRVDGNNCNDAVKSEKRKDAASATATKYRPIAELNALHMYDQRKKKSRKSSSIDFRCYKHYYKQDEDGDTLLHVLISEETFKHAFFVINITPNPRFLNIQNRDFLAPLHLAVMASQPLLCRALVLYGASTALQSSTGNTALHLACEKGDFLCAKAITEAMTPRELAYLVKKSKKIARSTRDFEIVNHQGVTSLHVAVSKGHVKIVNQLVRSGASVKARDGLAGMSALHFAIYHQRREIVGYLVKADPDVLEQRTMAGLTPYQMARSYDRIIAEDLKELGANCDADSECESDGYNCGYIAHNNNENEEIITDILKERRSLR